MTPSFDHVSREWWHSGPHPSEWSLNRVIDRCVAMALDGIPREFPAVLPLVFSHPVAISRPRDLTPVFYGCYDWHSAVHSHWLLVRACRFLSSENQTPIVRLLSTQLTAAGLKAEAEFLAAPERVGFERPYGLAWLLQLDSELAESNLPQAAEWRASLEPLVQVVRKRVHDWLSDMTAPVRTGEHSQSAFALGLIADWATSAGDRPLQQLLAQVVLRLYGRDVQLPVCWEPGRYDFLSPSLAEADLMRRFLKADDFRQWLAQALPAHAIASAWKPVAVVNPEDGKLAHAAGLNFSRAWMADGVAEAVGRSSPESEFWQTLSVQHFQAGLESLPIETYAMTHWVGSFALYAATRRGIRSAADWV